MVKIARIKHNRVKNLLLAAGILVVGMQPAAAQYMRQRPNTYNDGGDNEPGFKKENLFVGGGLALGFSNYDFNVGASPEIGYSLNRYLDAGVVVNINYSSERADPNYIYNDNTRYRSFNYGAGVFGRFWPVRFLFLQVQPEYNFIDYNEKYIPTGESATQHTNAASLLLGVGYGQRFIGQSSFYLSVSFDALDNQYSPYRDYNGAALPVIKAGFDIYLHKK
ncbi:MAG: hypothetical protein P4L51_19265 [Puia sp.]|nr:hypothetical protein [Puia sp.]